MKILALALALVTTAQAADWQHYRGPAQDGSTSEKIGTFSADLPRELWRAQVGTGLSSVTVAGSQVFTAGYQHGQEVLFALDAATGKPLWQRGWPAKLGDYLFEGGPRATPTFDSGRVYMTGADGHLVCLNAPDGKVLWEKNLVTDFGGKRMDWGFCSSPTIDGDHLLIDAGGPQGSTLALDKKTGELVWKAGDQEAGYGSVLIAKIDGKSTAIVFKAAFLVGHDAATGKVLWTFPWATDWKVNAAAPVVVGDLLVISSAYGHGAAGVRVKDGKAEQVWFNKKLKAHFNSPVERGGYLYGIDGEVGRKSALVCLEAKTGDEKWRAPATKNGSLILTADDRLLLLNEAGELLVVEATPTAYKELSRKKVLPGRCWVQPVLANGTIYCRNNAGELVALANRAQ